MACTCWNLVARRAQSFRFMCSSAYRKDFDEFTQAAVEGKKSELRQREIADQEDALKDQLLLLSLKYVPQYGWSRDALSAGAKELGYPGVISGVAAKGGVELIHFHCQQSNDRLVSEMSQATPASEVHSFLQRFVQRRLEMNVPYLSRWAEGLALMSRPSNVTRSVALELALIDHLWHFAGDTSTHMDWYAKRMVLLAVYRSTELAMTQNPCDLSGTWAFLDRRIKDMMLLHNANSQVRTLPAAMDGLLSTAKTLMGLPR